MNLKKILLVAGLGIMISNVFAQTSRRYTVAKPGTLVEMLTEEEANEITHLVLQGKLNAVDFRHLRDEFKKLQILTSPMHPSACMPERTVRIPTAFTSIPPIASRPMLSASSLATALLPEKHP